VKTPQIIAIFINKDTQFEASYVIICFMKSNTSSNNITPELAALITFYQDKIDAQSSEIAHLKNQNTNLLVQFKLAQQRRFGSSSEKKIGQFDLFDEAESNLLEQDSEEEIQEQETITYKRNKPKRTKLPESLPREIITIDISESEKQCACGYDKKCIGNEVTEKLEFIPAQVKVLAYTRPKYACNKCDAAVSIAPMPKLFLPKSIATPSLVAQTIISKYDDHLPLYRQEKIWQRYGINIPQNTTGDWVMKSYELCRPMIDALKHYLIKSSYIQADETSVQVMGESDRKNTSKSYMWLYQSKEPDNQVILFDYQIGRGSKYPQAMLDGFKGTLQTDCYAGYDWVQFEEDMNQIACMAHARRPFAELVKLKKKKGKSFEALALIKKLYAVEKKATIENLSFDERHQLRQEKALPVIKKLRNWIDKSILTAVPGSKLGLGIAYMNKHWHKLIGYLDDGCFEIDNNSAENKIRPFAIGRKNWMFSGSPRGASAASLFYSLIATARAAGIEPYKYLNYLFQNIIYCNAEQDYIELLPFNCIQNIN